MAKAKESLNTALNKYERSSTDAKQDKTTAKKMGLSTKAYENSPTDKRNDLKGAKALQKKDNSKRK